MNFNYLKKASLVAITLATIACNNDDDNDSAVSSDSFKSTYATIVAANYEDSYTTAVTLKTKIDAFITTPSATGLKEAKDAWLYARDFYGQTEAFREANGPIDNPDLLETEGRINAWPLDEAYIDYVSSRGQKVQNGLIGDTTFDITEANVLAKNEGTFEADQDTEDATANNIATGWHAIEFLLWGQDLNYNPVTHKLDNFSGSGKRQYTDYTTEENATRRKKYLQIVTNLLVNDLKDLTDTWAKGGSYRIAFEALEDKDALENILNGIGFISNGEISAERLIPAIDEGQENEHSCFSDNTNQDMWANVHGINNVIVGKYTREDKSVVTGVSLIELANKTNATSGAALKTSAESTLSKLDAMLALNKNFDQIIHEETIGSNGPAGQLSAALQIQGAAIAQVAKELGVTISIN